MLCASDAGGSAIFICTIPAFLSTRSETWLPTEIQRVTGQKTIDTLILENKPPLKYIVIHERIILYGAAEKYKIFTIVYFIFIDHFHGEEG